MRKKIIALSATTALLLTACSDAEGANSELLSDLELHVRDDGQPEVVLHAPVDADAPASRVLNSGDGEQVEEGNILEMSQIHASPEDGEILEENFGDDLPLMAWLPTMEETGQDIDEFVHNALTEDGVTIGTEMAVYHPPHEEGLHEEQLFVFRLEDQYPVYAEGEVEEQSAELPEITNEIGEAPELADHDTDSEPPEELSTEVLISGEGEEINEDDHIFAQYRGWQWENGDEFDGSWTEDGEPGEPFDFSLEAGVIEGWLDGIPGHNVGDRLLLVIPPEEAYGESEDSDGLTEEGQPGGHLIFAIDIIQAISADDIPDQPEPAPEEDIGEEELEELLEEMEDGDVDLEDSDDDDDDSDEEEED